jgi:hypothetical protein
MERLSLVKPHFVIKESSLISNTYNVPKFCGSSRALCSIKVSLKFLLSRFSPLD